MIVAYWKSTKFSIVWLRVMQFYCNSILYKQRRKFYPLCIRTVVYTSCGAYEDRPLIQTATFITGKPSFFVLSEAPEDSQRLRYACFSADIFVPSFWDLSLSGHKGLGWINALLWGARYLPFSLYSHTGSLDATQISRYSCATTCTLPTYGRGVSDQF